jgi:hypothetical protein
MRNSTRIRESVLATFSIAILALFYGTVCALAADMKVIPKDYSTIRSWICGYSAGFEDGIRKLDDPRQPESEQCAKFRERAKSVVK